MMSLLSRRAADARRLMARLSVLALALYTIGAAAHFAHHVVDRDCEGRGAPHACVTCQALHGGITLSASAPAVQTAPYVGLALTLPEIAAPAGIPAGIAPARAPPTA